MFIADNVGAKSRRLAVDFHSLSDGVGQIGAYFFLYSRGTAA